MENIEEKECKIKQLDEHMINLIAAGEVIERASSVVKELVENAIDAGATKIDISLVDSGIKEITVSDNGCGMNEQEMKMAILPHATSKIKNDNDLFAIRTLGFRGEALASIVAVSNVKIKSSDGSRGTMLGLKAGVITSEAYIGYPKGTEIQVRNLFFNTPARLQNLKGENVELSYVVDYVCKIALACPRIAFKLTNNDSVLFQSFGNGNRLEVLGNVYDVNVAKNMITVAESNGIFKISGLVSNISVTRASKNNITIIVNNRVVKNYNIVNAILEGYNQLLTVGRYPICVIEIFVDYSLVDVNVHPTKAEVRFSEEESLLLLIKEAVHHALMHQSQIVNRDTVEEEPTHTVYEETALDREEDEVSEDADEEVHEETETESTVSVEESFPWKTQEPVEPEIKKTEDIFTEKEVETESFIKDEDEEKEVKEEKEPEPNYVQQEIDFVNDDVRDTSDETKINKLFYIGQLFGTYILAQNDDGFYMIDQHAANERINYEKIYKEFEKQEVVSYEIMFPLNLSFTPSDAILVKEKMDVIKSLGIELEDFGGNSFVVRQVPIWMAKNNVNEYVEEIINQVINNKRQNRMEFLDNMAKSLACKKSVRGNEYLSSMQIEFLLEDLVKCNNPYTCPHGRPIIIKYSKYEIEKWFKRVQ